MSPELRSEQVDYKAISKKLLHSQEMTEAEEEAVFSIGLRYAAGLVEEKASTLLNYEKQRPGVIKYLDIAVLGRIITLHEGALKNGINTSESIVAFDDLKNRICGSLSMKCSKLPDQLLNTFFDRLIEPLLDKEIERINPEPQELSFIRMTLPKIIAENPPIDTVDTGIKHTLD